MTRASQFIMAALFAAVLGVVGLAPARAAGIPTGPAITTDLLSKSQTESVRHHRRGARRGRAYRRHHYRPYRAYRPPVYYRRCVNRPRVVWTPYGYVRRWVRVCR